MYHSISDQAQPRFRKYVVSSALFAEHLTYLHQQEYTTLTVSEYVHAIATGARLPQRVVVLTFDDGLADFYNGAFPLLKQYGFVATLYIPTAFVGETSRFLWRENEADRSMLSWSQLRDLSANGMECGAHSHRHLQLDVIPLAYRSRRDHAQQANSGRAACLAKLLHSLIPTAIIDRPSNNWFRPPAIHQPAPFAIT